jgi:ATP-dependent Clp protease ATP-binding subunit ClpC
LDEIIVFHSLNKKALLKIVETEISYVNKRLIDQGFEVTLDKGAKDFFVEKGFDPVYGARPLKRVIQRYMEDPLAEQIIKGQFAGKKKTDKTIQIKISKKGAELKFD